MAHRLFKGLGLAGVAVLAIFAVSQLPGCGGGGGGGATTPSGSLQVALTDKQRDDFQQVVVTIREVRVVPAGMENAQDNDARLPVVVSYAVPHTVDILSLHFQQEILGTITLPAGTYSQVRLILEPNPTGGVPPVNYLTLKTDLSPTPVKYPLKTPSAQQSGLKVLGQFTVKPGVLNAIILDFDPNTAIVVRGNGDYNLKPTGIRIMEVFSSPATSGSISGMLRSPAFKPLSSSTFKSWSSATVAVVPRNAAAAAITSGIVFSDYSGAGVWKAPFVAFVPPNNSAVMQSANYKVFVQAYRDTRMLKPAFRLYSSPLMSVNSVGVDYPVPPDGVVQFMP
ncbi:DUF4382 domain-containing protein [Geomobilimonas luticola]|uniref:DUF4382 domain-containing protein n=1 Tax=Geomobilimonas luticola TaxID=1114878 RepID=A0ABS5SES2_9BACT|nr:DUF4382 domain-containing protein [Geomobilimonas luticola]MBT0653690.1 DUF4382 domain-containing protein [Geomobilimonas luticola]